MNKRRLAGTNKDKAIDTRVRFWQKIGSATYDSQEFFTELVTRTFERCEYPQGLDRQLAAIWATGDRTELLQGITVPAHVIHGTDDSLLPLAHGEHVAEHIPGSTLTVVEAMGHAFQPEIIDVLMDSVIPFLDEYSEK